MSWKSVRKFDAHVHVLPPERVAAFAGDSMGRASIELLLEQMDSNNVEKALLVPTNNPHMYRASTRQTNEFTAEMIARAPGRLFGFSDLQINGASSMHEAASELEYAIKTLGLCGLKIHPANLNIPADDLRLVPVLRKAADLGVPVLFHSNPWGPGFYDVCTPERINKMIAIFPDLKIITAHCGGRRIIDAINAVRLVDISGNLPELVDIYGLEQLNRIFRKFGPARLLFGTDFPEASYAEYFEILDRMDFSEAEVEQIAYTNMNSIIENIRG